MSYGLTVLNDGDYIQIDSSTPRLACIHQGTYSGQFSVSVTFPSPVTTAEPPCVFIRPAANLDTGLHGSININGSAGAWTGFTLVLTNINHVTSGTWFAAVFAATTLADYGLRIWDDDGNPIYDTGSPPVLVSGSAYSWVSLGRIQLGVGFAYYWACPLSRPIGPHDHFLINPFSRWLMTTHVSNSMQMGVTVDYPNNRLLMYAVGTTLPFTNIGQHAGVFARIRN